MLISSLWKEKSWPSDMRSPIELKRSGPVDANEEEEDDMSKACWYSLLLDISQSLEGKDKEGTPIPMGGGGQEEKCGGGEPVACLSQVCPALNRYQWH